MPDTAHPNAPPSHATGPLLSVVLVNYRTPALTLDCLQSVYESAARSDLISALEVIVIDNASGDGSAAQIQAAYPAAHVVANAVNSYFSAGYTAGVRLARGAYILVLNTDMIVCGEALAQLVRQMQADPGIGAATTTMFFPARAGETPRLQRNGSRFVSFPYLLMNYTFLGKLFPAWLRAMNTRLWYADWDRTTPRDIDVLPGSCIIAPRAIWAQTGGFDARMKMYFSDDYLSRAVQRIGKRTAYLISDGIVHFEGGSSRRGGQTVWALNTYLRDLIVYTRLVFGMPAAALLAIGLIPTWLAGQLRARRGTRQLEAK